MRVRFVNDEMRLNDRAAERLGLTDKLLQVGWGGLSAQETGRIGGLVSGMKKHNGKDA